jgi:AraC-like DNA-binding protein
MPRWIIPEVVPQVHQVVRIQRRFPDQPSHDNTNSHPTHVLACHLRVRGRVRYGLDDRLARGPCLVLIAAGERYRHRLTGPFTGIWCLFSTPSVTSVGDGRAVAVAEVAPRIERSHLRQLDQDEARAAVAMFSELTVAARRPDAGSRLRAGVKLLELLALWGGRSRDQQHAADTPLEAFRAQIERHAFDGDVTLAALADRVGLSADRLGALFTRSFGMPPVQYRGQLRLARARELLLNSRQSIAGVARAVGFPDAAYFTRVFRRAYGQTPSRYACTHALNID